MWQECFIPVFTETVQVLIHLVRYEGTKKTIKPTILERKELVANYFDIPDNFVAWLSIPKCQVSCHKHLAKFFFKTG